MTMAGKLVPRSAMILAAGFGKRMRPLTNTIPKPLIEIGNKPLIDWSLDCLREAGVAKAVVNVHYLGQQIIDHVSVRQSPHVVISDEREKLLDSAGGIVNALPELGEEPFYLLNADTFWIDRSQSSLIRMAEKWDSSQMDMLLLMAPTDHATGHSGTTDFLMKSDGRLTRAKGSPDGLIYAGAAIVHPRIFHDATAEPHSLNIYFDQAIAAGRLYGSVLDGDWITVGTPEAIEPAERAILASKALAS